MTLPEDMRERVRGLVTNTAWEVNLLHNNYDVRVIEEDSKLHELVKEELDTCTIKIMALLEEVDRKARIEEIHEQANAPGKYTDDTHNYLKKRLASLTHLSKEQK